MRFLFDSPRFGPGRSSPCGSCLGDNGGVAEPGRGVPGADGLSSPGLDSPDGPSEKRGTRFEASAAGCELSEIDVGLVDVPGSEDVEGLESIMFGDVVSWGGDVCGVIAICSAGRPVLAPA